MNDRRTLRRILKMLSLGYKQRTIAEVCGVSKALVQAYNCGRTGKRTRRAAGDKSESLAYRNGVCPTHGRVRMPCVECAATRYVHEHPEHGWSANMPLSDDTYRRAVDEQMKFCNEYDDWLNREIQS